MQFFTFNHTRFTVAISKVQMVTFYVKQLFCSYFWV